MGLSASEVFGTQQGREHVDAHASGGGDVDDGENHGSDPPEQDGVDAEQGEQGQAGRDIEEVHEGLRIREPPIYRPSASRFGG
jgi:hypothetical protein